jgi:hypothetical protein
MMRTVVPKINLAADKPEFFIGEENFFLTRGYQRKVATTVIRQIKRET